MDRVTLALVGGVLLLLIVATAVAYVLRRGTAGGVDAAVLEMFRIRVRAWWLLFACLAGAFVIGQTATIVMFWLISFWALREFITLTPTRPGDHRALFWVFFLCTPLQFFLVWLRRYDLYSTLIPVYAFLFILARIAMSGDAKRFLERTAKIQAGLLICVYCLSFAPALLTLEIADRNAAPADDIPGPNPPEASGEGPDEPGDASSVDGEAGDVVPDANFSETAPRVANGRDAGGTTRLLFFFVLVVQLSDAFQFAWSRLPSRHVIVPTISPARTWEGFLGGTASVTLAGAALGFATPLEWWQAAVASLVIGLLGFAGGLTMSAIKRDRGVKDFGTLVEGHGGVLDRIDSICFAAPVFFHLARFFLAAS